MTFKTFVTVVTAPIEITCVAALVSGWSSMQYILVKEHYFESGCNKSNTSVHSNISENVICHYQLYNLGLIYTLSMFISTNLAVAGGAIMDRFGVRILRDLSTFLFSVSCTAIAFSTPQSSWILYPAMILLACSGVFFFTSNMPVANLYPKLRGTSVNIMNGASAASIAMFTIAKQAYEHAISLKAIFLFLSSLGVLLTLRTYFLMPRKTIPYDVPNNFYYGIKEYFCKPEDDAESEPLVSDQQASLEKHNKFPDKSLKSCIFSSIYILGTLALAIQWLRLAFFIESLDAWLDYLLSRNKALISFNISVFGYMQFSALVLAVLNGITFDWLYHYFEKKVSLTSMQARLRGLAILSLICISSTLTYSVFTLINVIDLQYASYALNTMSDTFQSANLGLLVIQCFPMKHFGTLNGLAFFVSSIVLSMQFPLYYIAIHYFDGNFFVINLILLLLVIAVFAHPINLYRKSRQKQTTPSTAERSRTSQDNLP